MKGFVKTILNNLDDSAYEKNKLKVELYEPGSSNNEELLSKSEVPYDQIKNLSTYARTHNLKVYVKNMLKLNLMRINLIGVPIILGAITTWAFTSKKEGIEEAKIYKKYHLVFDEESLLENTPDDKIYVSSMRTIKSEEENIKNIYSINSSATIRFGTGKDTYVCYFDINSDDEWIYDGYDIASFIKLPETENKNIKELDEKYSFIIDEAAKIFIDTIPESKEKIEEILNNQKNDILVEIDRYIFEENREFTYSNSRWFMSIIMIIIDILYVFLTYYNRKELKYIKALENDNGYLKEDRINSLKLKYAKLQYQEMFMEAEKERIQLIKNILDKYSADQAILTKYEKTLLLEKKE